MIKIIGPRDPRDSNAINTTSRSPGWSRDLSPFYLGPVYLYDGYIAENVENGWQYSKVYQCHVDANGDPTDAYWQWATTGWLKTTADRYPMGKGAKPLYSFWEGQKLSYVEARKKIYAPIYSKAVAKTKGFQHLKSLYLSGKDIVLWDFDGYDYQALGMTLQDVMDNPNRKMGHAFVLAMMLESGKDYIKWTP